MREFKRRGYQDGLARLLLRGLGVLALLGLAILLVRGTWGMYVRMAAAAEAQEEADVELARVQTQTSGVEGSLGALSSQRGVETQIRERFDYAKPGEGEIDIVRTVRASSTQESAGESWWARIFHTLFVW